MNKVFLIALLLVIIAGLIMGGCAQPAPAPKPTPTPTPAPAPAPAPAPKPSWPKLTFVTPPSGTNPNVAAVAWSTMATKYATGIQISIEPAIGAPQAAVGFLQGNADITYLTSNILGPEMPKYFGGKTLAAGPQHLVSALGTAVHIVTTNPNINSVADFKGKKVLARVATGAAVEVTRQKILATFGLTDNDIILMSGNNGSHLAEQLREGVGEAAMIFLGLRDNSLIELCTAKDVKWISVPKENMEKVATEVWMSAGVIPAGTYPKQDKDVLAFRGLDSFDVRPAMAEDLAYELVKVFHERFDEITKMSPWSKTFIAKDTVTSAYLPFHAGAVKYYKEKGVWTPEAEALRQKLLNTPVQAGKAP